MLIIFKLSAINCGNPAANLSTLNARSISGSVSTTIFPAQLQIGCTPGFQFLDWTEIKIMNCTSAGIWIYQTCSGIGNLYYTRTRRSF